MTAPATFLLKADGITLTATHQVLEDLAHDLVRSWGSEGALTRPLVLHVGAHRSTRLPECDDALQIGIQTEQMYDQSGRTMWKSFTRRRLTRMVQQFDLILDLSEANARAYTFLPLEEQAKIRFGPWIFPQDPPLAHVSGTGLLFVGALNPRRSLALAKLGPRVVTVPDGTFGNALMGKLEKAEGLINLHYDDGIYSEYPRLLKAVLAGRAVWSEPLASPLIEGLHYFTPYQVPDADNVVEVQKAMSSFLCSNFPLRRFAMQAIEDRLISKGSPVTP